MNETKSKIKTVSTVDTCPLHGENCAAWREIAVDEYNTETRASELRELADAERGD